MRSIGRELASTIVFLLFLTATAFGIGGNAAAEIDVASPPELFAVQRPQTAPATATESGETMARQILDETNLARTQPGRYAGYVREMRGRFVGKAYRLPNSTTMVMTSEGVPAVDEAIAFLSKQKPLHALTWSPGLAEAAEELIRDQGTSGQTGHDGKSGGMRERVDRHGTWSGRIGENIGYGPNTARLMVMELIIDDGVPDRGHRKNIFSSHFKTAGAACGPHPVYRNMCVMEFATTFKSEKK